MLGSLRHRFSFLRWPLFPLSKLVTGIQPKSKLGQHLAQAPYSIRLLRYWWAGQALAEEAERIGRPLRVLDLGCERGWLKHFTPASAVAHWTGFDWNPKRGEISGYDEIHAGNADQQLPFSERQFDAVVSLHVFEHLPRPAATLGEVSRILKPGGIFLGGTPTMPHIFAVLREKYFRRMARAGRIPPGGHITCISPRRWRALSEEVGLDVEFAVGSHAVRMTGSRLEHFRWWIRLNQLWGALFPSLGSECYLRARREPAWASAPAPLPRGNGRPRLAWAAAAAGTLLALGTGLLPFWNGKTSPASECPITAWLDQHQSGDDHFIVLADDHIPAHIRSRSDVTHVEEVADLRQHLLKNRSAHLMVESDDLDSVIQTGALAKRPLLSRLIKGPANFFLLQPEPEISPDNSGHAPQHL
jgi:SAM-dependent methyltransferase